MATHSSILAWVIPWTEEPAKLQSTGSQRVRHDWATHAHSVSVLPHSHASFCFSLALTLSMLTWVSCVYQMSRTTLFICFPYAILQF